MKFARRKRFVRDYARLQAPMRKKVDRQLGHLARDIRHPGLRAKKVTGAPDIWEARIDIHNRLTFQIDDETIVLRRVGTHPILKKP